MKGFLVCVLLLLVAASAITVSSPAENSSWLRTSKIEVSWADCADSSITISLLDKGRQLLSSMKTITKPEGDYKIDLSTLTTSTWDRQNQDVTDFGYNVEYRLNVGSAGDNKDVTITIYDGFVGVFMYWWIYAIVATTVIFFVVPFICCMPCCMVAQIFLFPCTIVAWIANALCWCPCALMWAVPMYVKACC